MDQATLLTQVQRRTGVRLSSTDPVLAAAVINEGMLDEIQKLVKGVGGQLDAALVQAEVSAKASAAKVIMDASVWFEERLKTTAEAAGAEIVAAIRAELRQATVVNRLSTKLVWISGSCAAASAAIAVGLFADLI